MKTRPFGPTKRPVSVIGMGTWQMESDDRKQAIAAIRLGLDLGMNHIDTAEMYGGGAVETMVGKAIEDRRDDVFLVSKVLPHNASRKGTIEACERSLQHLGTDHLDCYLLHWRGQYPLLDTFESFERLKKDGKILSWGVSNFDVGDLEEGLAAAGGTNRIACNQVLYYLGERAIEHAVLPGCEKQNIAITGYSPFSHGQFPNPRTEAGRVLAAVAQSHSATPRQVALAFLTRRPALFAIPKSSNPTHVRENAAAADLTLTKSELALLETAFPQGPQPTELPTL